MNRCPVPRAQSDDESRNPMFKNLLIIPLSCLCLSQPHSLLHAQIAEESCPRPSPGSIVAEPEDLRSLNGVLKLELTVHNTRQSDGSTRYCYLDDNGRESPTLRVSPGDLVILTLKNDLTAFGPDAVSAAHQHMHMDTEKSGGSCASDSMTREST